MIYTSPFIRVETFFFINYCNKITVNGFIKNGSFLIGISGNNITRHFLKKIQKKIVNVTRKEKKMKCENSSGD